jgi:hypothetical protein
MDHVRRNRAPIGLQGTSRVSSGRIARQLQAAVTPSPCLDLLSQPEHGLTLLDKRLREVRVAAAVDADALGAADPDDLCNLMVVDEIGGVYAHFALRHTERVVDRSNTSSSVEPANRHDSGPGGAGTPRGLATTEVPVMTIVDPTRPRSGGAP